MTARRVSGAQPFALFCAAGARQFYCYIYTFQCSNCSHLESGPFGQLAEQWLPMTIIQPVPLRSRHPIVKKKRPNVDTGQFVFIGGPSQQRPGGAPRALIFHAALLRQGKAARPPTRRSRLPQLQARDCM
jgi:hypothetical protein